MWNRQETGLAVDLLPSERSAEGDNGSPGPEGGGSTPSMDGRLFNGDPGELFGV